MNLDYTKSLYGWLIPIILIYTAHMASDLLQYFPTGLKYGTWNTDIVLSKEEADKFGISYVFNDSIPIQRDVVLNELFIWNNSSELIEIDNHNPLIMQVDGEGLFIDCQIKKTKYINSSEIKFHFSENTFQFTTLNMSPNSAVLLQILAVNYDPSWIKLGEKSKNQNPTEIYFLNKDTSYASVILEFLYLIAITCFVGKLGIWNYQNYRWDMEFLSVMYHVYIWFTVVWLFTLFRKFHFFPSPFLIS